MSGSPEIDHNALAGCLVEYGRAGTEARHSAQAHTEGILAVIRHVLWLQAKNWPVEAKPKTIPDSPK